MKYFFRLLLLMMLYNVCNAQNGSLNLALPSSPGSYQSDRFRAGELDCSMAIGGGINVEFGVVGVMANNNTTNQIITNGGTTSPNAKDVGVYGRITIPIDAPKGRVDCNRLYEMELRKRSMEIEKLERELNNLKALKFEK
jgi:hypothetical protein